MSPAAASPANDAVPATPADNPAPEVPAKISAYYSLVFPNITFFLQTLTVTIGRRCLPLGSDAPSSAHSPVDVDLGPLKSVSRLHARIEYEEDEARFVLVVIGRNGAWVDGVWSGTGSRVPLGERAQIQIASRTFHFVLPPPATLEDSPSPSSASSVQRARSPSVDITSISPPSSLPSHSPPPQTAPLLPPSKPPRSPDPQLPNSDAIPCTMVPTTSTSMLTPSTSTAPTAPTSKKRKKASRPISKPDVMPPKPSLTYAQLCYRAIKAMGGKATLQDICGWMVDNYDWYRYNEGAGWENSVRHNLSSGRAFKKMERSTGEHGKGFFWSVDPQYEHTFEQQEARAAALAQPQSASSSACPSGGKDSSNKGPKKKDKAVPLDPPFKRSVKSGVGPLPPPLTSTPLAFPNRSVLASTSQIQGEPFTAIPRAIATNVTAALETKSGPAGPVGVGLNALLESLAPSESGSGLVSRIITPMIPGLAVESSVCGSSTLPSDVSSSITPSSTSPLATLPPSVCLPIVIGSIPSLHPSSSTAEPPPIVLHNNTLVLSPVIFSSLAPEQLKALEEMGAQKALEVLQAHIVRYLKERMGKKKRKKAATSGVAVKGGTKTDKVDMPEQSSPFTTTPLPLRAAQATPTVSQESTTLPPLAQPPITKTALSDLPGFRTLVPECCPAEVKEGVPSPVDTKPPVPVPISRLQTPIVVVDDDDEKGRTVKRRKLGHQPEVKMELKQKPSSVYRSQVVDEDIEVDIC